MAGAAPAAPWAEPPIAARPWPSRPVQGTPKNTAPAAYSAGTTSARSGDAVRSLTRNRETERVPDGIRPAKLAVSSGRATAWRTNPPAFSLEASPPFSPPVASPPGAAGRVARHARTPERAVPGRGRRPDAARRRGALSVPLRYLLDTSVVSDLLRNPRGVVAGRMASAGEGAVCTSIVVVGECAGGRGRRGCAGCDGIGAGIPACGAVRDGCDGGDGEGRGCVGRHVRGHVPGPDSLVAPGRAFAGGREGGFPGSGTADPAIAAPMPFPSSSIPGDAPAVTSCGGGGGGGGGARNG